jgi:hypothetical protein
MEGGHWDLVRTLLINHQSDMLGPYFLPAIAQQGKIDDLAKMVEIIQEVGCSDPEYLSRQVSSAIVSAALGGSPDMLVALEGVRERLGVLPKAEAPAGADGGSDKTEL